jgi:hypothetical protein
MKQDSSLFVGLDVSKLKISVAVADGTPGGEVPASAAFSSAIGLGTTTASKISEHRLYRARNGRIELVRCWHDALRR